MAVTARRVHCIEMEAFAQEVLLDQPLWLMGKKYKLSQLLEAEWNRESFSPSPVPPTAPIQNPRIKQLSLLDELGWQPEKDCSGQAVCPEQVVCPEQACPEQKHWVETYSPSNRKQHSYYRYVWREGRKLRHLHLPGGNVDNQRAIALKERVENAIAIGMPPAIIEQMIKEGNGKEQG